MGQVSNVPHAYRPDRVPFISAIAGPNWKSDVCAVYYAIVYYANVYALPTGRRQYFLIRAEPRFMPKIKFVKEKKEVEVEAGANLRKAAIKEGVELYPGVHKYVNCMGFAQCRQLPGEYHQGESKT